MRRRAGLGAIQKQQYAAEKYKDKGEVIQEDIFKNMSKQMEIFKDKLEDFAIKHKNEIKKNPRFRRQFQEMCASIGVDPLASAKGFWSVLGIGDYYYELAVQVIEVCLATQHLTGGLIEVSEVRDRLVKARGKNAVHQEITNDDIITAASKLKIFGSGFEVHKVSKGKYMIQSVPGELSLDETSLITLASKTDEGCITQDLVMDQLKWTKFRTEQAITKLIGEGVCWIDRQGDIESYWFPSMFPGRQV